MFMVIMWMLAHVVLLFVPVINIYCSGICESSVCKKKHKIISQTSTSLIYTHETHTHFNGCFINIINSWCRWKTNDHNRFHKQHIELQASSGYHMTWNAFVIHWFIYSIALTIIALICCCVSLYLRYSEAVLYLYMHLFIYLCI